MGGISVCSADNFFNLVLWLKFSVSSMSGTFRYCIKKEYILMYLIDYCNTETTPDLHQICYVYLSVFFPQSPFQIQYLYCRSCTRCGSSKNYNTSTKRRVTRRVTLLQKPWLPGKPRILQVQVVVDSWVNPKNFTIYIPTCMYTCTL